MNMNWFMLIRIEIEDKTKIFKDFRHSFIIYIPQRYIKKSRFPYYFTKIIISMGRDR